MLRYFAVLILVLPMGAAANPTGVDPTVVAVVSGGWWQATDGTSGSFRIIVRSSGFGHVSSQVTAEWIAEPREPTQLPRIVHAKELIEPGFFSIGMPKLEVVEGRIRITLDGVVTHAADQNVVCIFELSPGGEVKRVQPCQ